MQAVKTFNTVLEVPTDNSTTTYDRDPLLHATDEVMFEIRKMHMEEVGRLLLANIIATFLVAPIQTISQCMQLSVAPHRHIYQTPEAYSKELSRLNTELTVHDRRKLELIIRTGGTQNPYSAPVYGSYSEIFSSLQAQGMRAFYKGNLMRTLTTTAVLSSLSRLNTVPSKAFETTDFKLSEAWLLALLTATIISPLYVLENRFTIQSGFPQFKIYKSFKEATIKIFKHKQYYKGNLTNAMRNGICFGLQLPIFFQMTQFSWPSQATVSLFLLGDFLTYPLLTSYRRFVSQSTRLRGAIPIRYSSCWHGLKVIGAEEGYSKLWKGYSTNLIAQSIRLLTITGFMKMSIKAVKTE